MAAQWMIRSKRLEDQRLPGTALSEEERQSPIISCRLGTDRVFSSQPLGLNIQSYSSTPEYILSTIATVWPSSSRRLAK